MQAKYCIKFRPVDQAMKVLVICALSLALSEANRVSFWAYCEANDHNINYVDIEPCEILHGQDGGADMCQFRRSTTIQLHVNFQTANPITAAKPVVTGIIPQLLELPDVFELPSDACSHMNPPCSPDDPLQPRTNTTYSASIYIHPSYPEWRVVAKWEIRDQHDHQVMCFTVPIQIKA